MGRQEDAAALSLKTLDGVTRVLGPDQPDTLQVRNVLAGCYRALDRNDEALALRQPQALLLYCPHLSSTGPDAALSGATRVL
jgi:Tetratricopeptide repeat